MKIIALNASPNQDGLTAACAQAFLAGAEEAGAEVKLIHLCALSINSCRQCDRGWGQCRQVGTCIIEDDLEQVRQQILVADAWALVNPVYFGDLSEVAKRFTDRLRRCTMGSDPNLLKGKDFVGVGAAGGSGRGTVTCLEVMDRFAAHTGLRVADLVTVTRRSRPYKLECLKSAGRSLVKQEWSEGR